MVLLIVDASSFLNTGFNFSFPQTHHYSFHTDILIIINIYFQLPVQNFCIKYPNNGGCIHDYCLVLRLVSVIVLNKPPSLWAPPPNLPLLHWRRHPLFSQRPVPLLSQSLLQLGSLPVCESWCVLWQRRVCAATADDVRMPPKEVTIFSPFLSVFLRPVDRLRGVLVCGERKRFVKMSINVRDIVGKHWH